MREGLRSRTKKAGKDEAKMEKVEGDSVLLENDTVSELVGSVREQDEDVSVVKEETERIDGLDQRMCSMEEGNSGDDVNDVDESVDKNRKRSMINGEVDGGDGVREKKRAKEETVGDRMVVVGRVLRPRAVVNVTAEEEEDYLESKGVRTKNGDLKDDGFGIKIVGIIKEENNHSDGAVNLKRKRGRPRKDSMKETLEVKTEGNDHFGDGGCEKSDNNVSTMPKRKRGRPRKSQVCCIPLKQMEAVKMEKGDESALENCGKSSADSEKKLKSGKGVKSRRKLRRKRGRPPKSRESCNPAKEMKEVKKKLKESNLKSAMQLKYVNTKREGSDVLQSTGEAGIRRTQKQAIRDKIVEMLLAAGWTVELRPRNGRDYNDAVYVNPEGRTHWSITKAYRVLKEHYENCGSDSKNFKTGFSFTPLQEDELGLLTKIVSKVRCDKNQKKNKWKNDKRSMKVFKETISRKGWTMKLPKRKLGVLAGPGAKNLKKRLKLKIYQAKHDDSTDVFEDATATSSRGRKRLATQDRKRCGLVARCSNEGDKSAANGYVLYNGKRSVLSWMIDLGTVPLDGKVSYSEGRRSRAVRRGRILQDGICCDCCAEAFTVLEFERHAGGKSCQPFGNIYLENGCSLLQCLLESWNKLEESVHKGFHFVDVSGEDPNDDTCGICGDGGDLICCDGCPSTFHRSCLDIKRFPSGLWHCIYCSCKICGMFSIDTCQKNDIVSSVTPSLLTCCLCEEKYHQSCVQSEDAPSDAPPDQCFCGKKCQKLYEELQSLLGVKHDLGDGFAWTIVRRFDIGSDISIDGMPRKIECNSKVAVAWLVMDECFLPMADHRTGSNLIRNVVYNFGSNFNRLNYGGFLTAILERGDETMATASIRIHGNNLAEMPFIGTRYNYRRQGMCRRLLSGIEMALRSLNVEKLVIPAISELWETWTSIFGFEPVEGLSQKEMKKFNMIVFPGVDMLQKPLLQHQLAEDSVNCDGVLESLKLNGHQLEARNSEDCSSGDELRDLNEPCEVKQNPLACSSNGHSFSTEVTLVSEQVK